MIRNIIFFVFISCSFSYQWIYLTKTSLPLEEVKVLVKCSLELIDKDQVLNHNNICEIEKEIKPKPEEESIFKRVNNPGDTLKEGKEKGKGKAEDLQNEKHDLGNKNTIQPILKLSPTQQPEKCEAFTTFSAQEKDKKKKFLKYIIHIITLYLSLLYIPIFEMFLELF